MWALQHWVEEANPAILGGPCLLAMSVIELRWHVGSYINFSKHDILKGSDNVVPKAMDKDRRTPPAVSIASPATSDVKDTPLSSMVDDTISLLPSCKTEAEDEDVGAPPADDTAVLVAEADTEIQKDLLANWGASLAKVEDSFAPTPKPGDELTSPTLLASHSEEESQEYPQWVKIYSPQEAATVGSAPDKHRESHQCCSSKQCKGI